MALAGALGPWGKHGADLKGPEAGAASLQVAPCSEQQLLHQAIAQMAVVGQEGIGEGHPRGNRWGRRRGFRPGGTELAGGRSQGKVAGFLQAGGGQGPAQAPLHLLVGTEAPRFERIGQVAGKPVVAHQAGHLLNQVHLAHQILAAGGRHQHVPTLATALLAEVAAQGGQGLNDLVVFQVLQLSRFAVQHLHLPQQLVQGVAAEQHGGGLCRRPLVTPTTDHGGATQLLQQGHGPIGRRQGDLGGQALFKAAAGIGAQADAAGTAAHRLGGEDGRLQPDGRGAVGHGAVGAPDHPGQGDGGLGVGDDQGLFIELVPTAIEGPEGLAAAGLA